MGFAEQSREKVATDCGDGLRVGREELGQAAPGGCPGGHRREVPLSSDMQTVDRPNFNTPFIPKDKSSRQKINKETQDLNDTSDLIDLIDIYRIFHLKAAEYTFLSCTRSILQDRSHLESQIKLQCI